MTAKSDNAAPRIVPTRGRQKLGAIRSPGTELQVAPWLEEMAPYSCRIDRSGALCSVSTRLAVLLGADSVALRGRGFHTLCEDAGERAAIRAALSYSATDVLDANFVDMTVRGADGRQHSIRWFLSTYRRAGDGAILALGWDEVARPQMERFLLRLARIADSSEHCLVLVNARGVIEYVNPAVTATTGHSPEDVIGRNVSGFVAPLEDVSMLQRALEAFQRGESWRGRLAVQGNDGKPVVLQVKIAPVCEGEAQTTHYIVTGVDVSKQRNLERQIEELQRLEAVSSLANGLAHRFNNILAAISGQTELLLMTPNLDDKLRQRGERILEASHKGKEAVEQLTIFSRKSEARCRAADLCPVVRNAVRFIRTALPRVVNLIEEIPGECSLVLANTDEIHQVVVNLLTNALEAFGDTDFGCEIAVSLREENCNLNGREGTPCVVISVRDNGPGIPLDIQHRIFEPFFSTRNMGRSSGMGLATAHGIVTRHNGAIRVCSEIGRGALFEVVLPVIRQERRSSLPVYKGRVLLVDSSAFSLETGKRILGDLGYVVNAYSNPIQALDELPTFEEPPDLLIAELQMPQIDGLSFTRAVRCRLPELPVLLCAGWSDPVNLEEAGKAGVNDILRRPAPVEQIEKAVAAILTFKVGQSAGQRF